MCDKCLALTLEALKKLEEVKRLLCLRENAGSGGREASSGSSRAENLTIYLCIRRSLSLVSNFASLLILLYYFLPLSSSNLSKPRRSLLRYDLSNLSGPPAAEELHI